MEKTFPGIVKRSKLFAHTLLIWFLNQYILRANNHSTVLSKTWFIHLGIKYIQHSNTPLLQHSYILHVGITEIATDIPITNSLDSHP